MENTDILRHALAYAGSCDMTVHLQAEDRFLRGGGVAHEGATGTRLGLPPVPATAETVAVSRILLLMEETGASVHFCRLSAAHSIELVREAKRTGLSVSADAGICYLHLTEADVDGFRADCHLRPPLRSEYDREALRQGIADGSIDAVCSDHQPHDDDAKAAPFAETEPGASNIELLLPLVLDLVDGKVISLNDAIARLTCGPAAILGVDHGSLGTGKAADIAVIDPRRVFSVDRDGLLSAGRNNPFHGRRLRGLVTHTFFDGRLVYQRDGA